MQILAMVMVMSSGCYGQAPDYICPMPTSISPCTCSQYYNDNSIPISKRIAINCKGKNLTDFQISKVLNSILFSKGLSPVIQISATNNQLTRFPEQISKFTALSIVDLSYNQITEIPCVDGKPFLKNYLANQSVEINLRFNQIARIPSGVFHFPSAFSVSINLSNNRISSIPSDAFRFPYATVVGLYLDYNQIREIPVGVFNYLYVVHFGIYLLGNGISEIPPDAFNFPLARDVAIYLGGNGGITSIPPGLSIFHQQLDELSLIFLVIKSMLFQLVRSITLSRLSCTSLCMVIK